MSETAEMHDGANEEKYLIFSDSRRDQGRMK